MRDRILRVVFVALFFSCAGCGDDGDIEENQFKFFNWWTTGGELAALNKLVALYQNKYPDVTVENAAITGGAGVNLKTLLYDKGLKVGKPPDSYQIHIGDELKPDLQYLQPVTSFFSANNWSSVLPATIIQAVTFTNEQYAVPLNIHRSNVLWYRRDMLKAAGYEDKPPTTWTEFFTIADKLKTAGKQVYAFNPCVSSGSDSSWTAGHMFESILLAGLGNTKYLGLFDGTQKWDGTEVLGAFDTLQKLMTYKKSVPDKSTFDVKSMTTTSDPAAMTIMGDWFEGDMKAEGWTPGTEFGWAAAPGTSSYFMYLSDSFTLPKNAPHEANAKRWLELVGSMAGQDEFNLAKGSIPARTDADKTKYDKYLQSAINDFKSKTLVPSIAHGAIGSPTFKSTYFTVIGKFIAGKIDKTKAAQDLVTAAGK